MISSAGLIEMVTPAQDSRVAAFRRFTEFLARAYNSGGVLPAINKAIPAPCLLHAVGFRAGGTPEIWLAPALEFMLNGSASLKKNHSGQRSFSLANDFVEMVITETPRLGDFFFDIESSGAVSVQVADFAENPPLKVIQPPFFYQRRLNGPHFVLIGEASIPE